MNGAPSIVRGTSRQLLVTGLVASVAAAAVVATRTDAQAHTAGPTQSGVSSGVTEDRVVIKTRPREGSRFTSFRLDFVPGAATPWHSHTGPGLVTVVDGSFVLTRVGDDGCERRHFSKGDAFVDPGDGSLHRLQATSAGAVTATFVTPADQPATVPAPAAPAC